MPVVMHGSHGTKGLVKPFQFTQNEVGISNAVDVIILISGSAAGLASGLAALKGAGLLVGTGSGKGAGSATLKGAGVLAGAGAGKAAGSATLKGAGALIGADIGRAVGSATLKGAGTLLGTSAGKATGSATLKGSGVLAGAGAGRVTASATLGALKAIIGSASGRVSTSAILKGSGVLLGASLGHVVVSGALSASGSLVGTGLGHGAGLGLLEGFGFVSGSAAGQVFAQGTLTSSVGEISGSAIGRGFAVGTISSFRPMMAGRQVNSLISEPIYIGTVSNDVELFKTSAVSSPFFGLPGGAELNSRPTMLVASGYVSIPPSAVNPKANFYLTLQGFDQGQRPQIAIANNAMSMPFGQPLAPGLYPWSVVCRFYFSSEPIWTSRRTTMSYTVRIGESKYSDMFGSSNNPFLTGSLQFSFGVEFSGSVSGSDMFEASLLQFETQQV